jgi:acyl-CoA synthetase (AMP-forming)/AMP-acid ligase II
VNAGHDPSTGLTVPARLAARASARGDHDLLICDDDRLTYRQAERRSAELAKGLLASGLGKGSHIGILYPNSSLFVVATLAAARIGAVTLPLSTLSTTAELRILLRNADIEVLLATRSYRGRDYVTDLQNAVQGFDPSTNAPLFTPDLPTLRRIVFDSNSIAEEGSGISDDLLAAVECSVHPSDRLVIVHTSGSTSEPKGVVHEHGSLIRHLEGLNDFDRYTENDVLFSNSPFFWIGGYAFSLLATMLAGATLVCSNATDAAETLDLLERTRPTIGIGFSSTVAHLVRDPSFPNRDLTSLRRGNLWPIMPEELRPTDLELRHNMLGMTETASVCLASDDERDQPEHRRGSFGRTVPGLESKIIDPESGAECDIGEVGELWLRGANMMEGYYGRERYEAFTPDGWYRSGDLMRVDTDGFHYFVGRRGDMIKTSSGANVAPREVEAAIADTTGLIAHVVGIEESKLGQVVAAAIRVPEGQVAPDEEELRALLKARLSAYKVPTRYLFLADDAVPMLSSGKLDTAALKDMLRTS